jgi:hypothetical protein
LSTSQSISLLLSSSSFPSIIDSIPIPSSIPFSSSFPLFYLNSTQFSIPSNSISDSILRPQGLPQDLFQDFLQDIICDPIPDYSNSSSIPQHLIRSSNEFLLLICITNTPNRVLSEPIAIHTAAKKKYKPVHLKVKPVIRELPDKFRIIRNIIGNPLKDLPTLPTDPLQFRPTGRYTKERKDTFDTINDGFLWPSEKHLLHYFMMIHNDAFAWQTSERGHFREDFFPPVDIPVVPHKPWIQRNIPIPPGLYDELCKLVKQKMDAGVFEPSNSSYQSRWFCVLKRDGKSLRIVQSLELLNKVTIAHSGVTPFTEQLAEQFAGRTCNSMLDLYVGYDERALASSSRDLTTFQTPYGALQLTTLPMGWTNSVSIFHDDVTYILQPEIPHVTQPYIDDIPVKGPSTRYIKDNGEPETIPENSGIWRFVWEHFQDLNHTVQQMKYSGGTFSGLKTTLCTPEITVLGH